MPPRHQIILQSDAQRAAMTAVVESDDEEWALIIQHDDDPDGPFTLELPGRLDGKPWRFPFDEALAVIIAAHHGLRGGPPREEIT